MTNKANEKNSIDPTTAIDKIIGTLEDKVPCAYCEKYFDKEHMNQSFAHQPHEEYELSFKCILVCAECFKGYI